MNAEPIADALLRVPGVTAVVAQRIALEQLPQGSEYPALVYRTISTAPVDNLCTPSAAHVSRLQVNPMAATMAEVNALHILVRAAVESDAPRTTAGRGLASYLTSSIARNRASIETDVRTELLTLPPQPPVQKQSGSC